MMNILRLTLSILLASLAVLAAPAARAQKAGDNVVSAGWFNIQTHRSPGPD